MLIFFLVCFFVIFKYVNYFFNVNINYILKKLVEILSSNRFNFLGKKISCRLLLKKIGIEIFEILEYLGKIYLLFGRYYDFY